MSQTTVPKLIVFKFRSGYECSHSPKTKSEDEWWELINSVIQEFSMATPGLFITSGPYGAHKLQEVEAIHFGDIEPPDDERLGFVK